MRVMKVDLKKDHHIFSMMNKQIKSYVKNKSTGGTDLFFI